MEIFVMALVATVCGFVGSRIGLSGRVGVLSAGVRAESYCLIFSALYKLELTLLEVEIAESGGEVITVDRKEAVDDAENEICRLHVTVGYMLPGHVNRELIAAIDTSSRLGLAERVAQVQDIRKKITAFARKDMGQVAT